MTDRKWQTEHDVPEDVGKAVAQARVYRMGSWVYLGIRVDTLQWTGESWDLARQVADTLPQEKLGQGEWQNVLWEREVEIGLAGDKPEVFKTPGRYAVCVIRRPLLHLAAVEPDTVQS